MTKQNFPQSVPSEAVLYLFYHVFLPPRTPQACDYQPGSEVLLLEYLVDALSQFKTHFTDGHSGMLDHLITMAVRLKRICPVDGDISETELTASLMDLRNDGEQRISK